MSSPPQGNLPRSKPPRQARRARERENNLPQAPLPHLAPQQPPAAYEIPLTALDVNHEDNGSSYVFTTALQQPTQLTNNSLFSPGGRKHVQPRERSTSRGPQQRNFISQLKSSNTSHSMSNLYSNNGNHNLTKLALNTPLQSPSEIPIPPCSGNNTPNPHTPVQTPHDHSDSHESSFTPSQGPYSSHLPVSTHNHGHSATESDTDSLYHPISAQPLSFFSPQPIQHTDTVTVHITDNGSVTESQIGALSSNSAQSHTVSQTNILLSANSTSFFNIPATSSNIHQSREGSQQSLSQHTVNNYTQHNNNQSLAADGKPHNGGIGQNINPNFPANPLNNINNTSNNQNQPQKTKKLVKRAKRPTSHQLETLLLTRRDKILYYHQFRSLYLFQPTDPFRQLCIQLSHNKWVEWILLIIVAVSIFFIASASNKDNRLFVYQPDYRYYVELVVNSCLTLEFLIKVIASGLIDSGQHSYFRQGVGNYIDFAMVALGWMSVTHLFDNDSPLDTAVNHTWLRQLRIIRLFKILLSLEATRLQLNVIVMSIPSLSAVMMGSMYFFGLFTYIFHQFGRPMTYRCVANGDLSTITDMAEAVAGKICSTIPYYGYHCPTTDPISALPLLCVDIGQTPDAQVTSFDNFPQAFLNVMISLSMEGWSAIMIRYTQSSEFGRGMFIVWIIFMILCGFIITRLIAAVLATNYEQSKLFETQRQKLLVLRKKLQVLVETRRRIEIKRIRDEQRTQAKLLKLEQARITQEQRTQQGIVSGATMIGDIDEEDEEDQVSCRERYSSWCDDRCGCLQYGGMSLKRYDLSSSSKNRKLALNKHHYGCHAFWPTRISSHPTRLLVRNIVLHSTLWSWITILLVAYNTAVLCAQFQGMEEHYLTMFKWYRISSFTTLGFFCLDIMVKFVAYGSKEYFSVKMNLYELAVTILSVAFFFSTGMKNNAFSSLHLLRVMRLMELEEEQSQQQLNKNKRLNSESTGENLQQKQEQEEETIQTRYFMRAVSASARDTFFCLIILLGFLFVAASIGRSFLADHMIIDGEESRSNFNSFLWACVTTFQAMSPENVNDVMYAAKEGIGWGGVIYIFILYFFGFYLILSLFLAVLVANFNLQSNEKQIELDELRKRHKELQDQRQLQSSQSHQWLHQTSQQFNSDAKNENNHQLPRPIDSHENSSVETPSTVSNASRAQLLSNRGSSEVDSNNNSTHHLFSTVTQTQQATPIPSSPPSYHPYAPGLFPDPSTRPYYQDHIARQLHANQYDNDSSDDDDNTNPHVGHFITATGGYQPPPATNNPYQATFSTSQLSATDLGTSQNYFNATQNQPNSQNNTLIASSRRHAHQSSQTTLNTSAFFTRQGSQTSILSTGDSSKNLTPSNNGSNSTPTNTPALSTAPSSSNQGNNPLPPPPPLPAIAIMETHQQTMNTRLQTLSGEVDLLDQYGISRMNQIRMNDIKQGKDIQFSPNLATSPTHHGYNPHEHVLSEFQTISNQQIISKSTQRKFVHVPWHHRPLALDLFSRLHLFCCKCTSRYDSLKNIENEHLYKNLRAEQREELHLIDHLYIEQHLRPALNKEQANKIVLLERRDLLAFDQAVINAAKAKQQQLLTFQHKQDQLLHIGANNDVKGTSKKQKTKVGSGENYDHSNLNGSESPSHIPPPPTTSPPPLALQDVKHSRRASSVLLTMMPALPKLQIDMTSETTLLESPANNTSLASNSTSNNASNDTVSSKPPKVTNVIIPEKPIPSTPIIDVAKISQIIRNRSTTIHDIHREQQDQIEHQNEARKHLDEQLYGRTSDIRSLMNLHEINPELDTLLHPLRLKESHEIMAARISLQRAQREAIKLKKNLDEPRNKKNRKNKMTFLSQEQRNDYFMMLEQTQQAHGSASSSFTPVTDVNIALYENSIPMLPLGPSAIGSSLNQFNQLSSVTTFNLSFDAENSSQQGYYNKISTIPINCQPLGSQYHSQVPNSGILSAREKLNKRLHSEEDDSFVLSPPTPLQLDTTHTQIGLSTISTNEPRPLISPQSFASVQMHNSDPTYQPNQINIPKQTELKMRQLSPHEIDYEREELITEWVISGAAHHSWPPFAVDFEDDDERKYMTTKPPCTRLDRTCRFICGSSTPASYNLYTQIYIKSRYQNNVCGCIGPKNFFRRGVRHLLVNPVFEVFLLLVILYSCVILALDVPYGVSKTTFTSLENKYNNFLLYSNYAVTGVFLMEILLKVFVYGLILGKYAYLQNYSNIIDMIATVTSTASILVNNQRTQISDGLLFLRALRSLRAVRFLTLSQGTKEVLKAIWHAVKDCLIIAVFGTIFFLIYGIIGVHFFHGKLQRCYDPTSTSPWDGALFDLGFDTCIAVGGRWVNPLATGTFDHLGHALLVLFQFSNLEAWPEYLYLLADATPYKEAPEVNYNSGAVIYVIIGVILIGFFLFSLLSGIIIDSYQGAIQIDLHPLQATFIQLYKLMLDHKPSTLLLPPKPPHKLNQHTLFKRQSLYLHLCLWVMESDTLQQRQLLLFESNNQRSNPQLPARNSLVGNNDVGELNDYVGPLNTSPSSLEDHGSDINNSFAAIPPLSTHEQALLLQSIAQLSRDLKHANSSSQWWSYKLRLALYRFVTWKYFELLPISIVLLNVISNAILYPGIDETFRAACKWITVVTSIALVAESIIKLLALGLNQFLEYTWFKVELVISIFALVDIFTVNPFNTVNWYNIYLSPKLFSTIRVIKLLKITQLFQSMKKLLATVLFSLAALYSLGFIMVVVVFIYAVMGINLFHNAQYGEYYTPDFDFKNFISAVILLFRSLTGENWVGVMYELGVDQPFCDPTLFSCGRSYYSYLYFITFQLICNFLLLNMVLAIVFKHIEVDFQDTAINKLNKLNNSKRNEEEMTNFEYTRYKMGKWWNQIRDKLCICPGFAPERALVRQRKFDRLQRKKARVALQKQQDREEAQRQRREFAQQYEIALLEGVNLDDYKKTQIQSHFIDNMGRQSFDSPSYHNTDDKDVVNVRMDDIPAHLGDDDVSSVSSRTSSEGSPDDDNHSKYNGDSDDDPDSIVMHHSSPDELVVGRQTETFHLDNVREPTTPPSGPQTSNRLDLATLRRSSAMFIQSQDFQSLPTNKCPVDGSLEYKSRHSIGFSNEYSIPAALRQTMQQHNEQNAQQNSQKPNQRPFQLLKQLSAPLPPELSPNLATKRLNLNNSMAIPTSNHPEIHSINRAGGGILTGQFIPDEFERDEFDLFGNLRAKQTAPEKKKSFNPLSSTLNLITGNIKTPGATSKTPTKQDSLEHQNTLNNPNNTVTLNINGLDDDIELQQMPRSRSANRIGVDAANAPTEPTKEGPSVYDTPDHVKSMLHSNPHIQEQLKKSGIDGRKLRQYTTMSNDALLLAFNQQQQHNQNEKKGPLPPPPPPPSNTKSSLPPGKPLPQHASLIRSPGTATRNLFDVNPPTFSDTPGGTASSPPPTIVSFTNPIVRHDSDSDGDGETLMMLRNSMLYQSQPTNQTSAEGSGSNPRRQSLLQHQQNEKRKSLRGQQPKRPSLIPQPPTVGDIQVGDINANNSSDTTNNHDFNVKRPSLLAQHRPSQPEPQQTPHQKRPSLLAQQPSKTPSNVKQGSTTSPTTPQNGHNRRGSVNTPMNQRMQSRQTQSAQQLQDTIAKYLRQQQEELGVDDDIFHKLLQQTSEVPPPPPAEELGSPLPYTLNSLLEEDEYDNKHPPTPHGKGGHETTPAAKHRGSLFPPPPPSIIKNPSESDDNLQPELSSPQPAISHHTHHNTHVSTDDYLDEQVLSQILTIPTITTDTTALPLSLDDLHHFNAVWGRLTRVHMYWYSSQTDFNADDRALDHGEIIRKKHRHELRHFISPTTSYQDTLLPHQLQTSPYKIHVTQLPTLLARLKPPLRPQLTQINIQQLIAQQRRQGQLFLLPFKLYYQTELQKIAEQILQYERDIFLCQQTLNKYSGGSKSNTAEHNNYKNKLHMLQNLLNESHLDFVDLENEYLAFLHLSAQTLDDINESHINNHSAIMLLIDELNIPCDGLYVHYIDVLYALCLRLLSNSQLHNSQDCDSAMNYSQMAREYIVEEAQKQLLLYIIRSTLRKQDIMTFVQHRFQEVNTDQPHPQNQFTNQSNTNDPDDIVVMNFNPLQSPTTSLVANMPHDSGKTANIDDVLFVEPDISNLVNTYDHNTPFPSRSTFFDFVPPISSASSGPQNQSVIPLPTITLHDAYNLSDIDCISYIIDKIPIDDVRLDVLRQEAKNNYPYSYILQYGDGTTPITHYNNPNAFLLESYNAKLTTATATEYKYDAGDILRIVKIQRVWRLRKEERRWKQILCYMDKDKVREALFVE